MAERDHYEHRRNALITYRDRSRALDKPRPLVSLPLAKLSEGGRALLSALPPSLHEQIGPVSRRSARFCLSTLMIVLAAIAIIGGAFYLRLMHGPISLKFLAPMVEQQINAQLGGYRFRVSDAILRLNDRWWLEFRLKDVSVFDTGGQEIAKAPLASVDLSLSAMGALTMAPSGIDLIGPKVLVYDLPQQGLAFSFSNAPAPASESGAEPSASTDVGQPRKESADLPEIARNAGLPAAGRTEAVRPAVTLVGALDRVFRVLGARDGASSWLNHFGVQKAEIYYVKDGSVSEWRVSDFNVSLDESSRRSALRGEIVAEQGSAPWRMAFKVISRPQHGTYTVNASFSDVVPRQVWNSFREFGVLKSFDMPVSARMRLDLDREGDVREAEAQVDLAQGRLYAPWDEKHPGMIDGARFRVRYDRDEGVASISPVELFWGDSIIRLAGQVRRENASGDSASWRLDLSSEKFALAAPQFGLPAIPMDEFTLQARYSREADRADIEMVRLRAADAVITMGGRIESPAGSLGVSLAGDISPMPLAFFKLIWPKFVAHGARDWIGTNVPSGRIASGRFAINLPPPLLDSLKRGGDIPDEAVSLDLQLTGLVVHHLKGLPPIRSRESTARVVGRRFVFEIPGPAAITLPSGKDISLTDGQFIVGDLRPRYPRGEVHFKAEGEVEAALELLDHEPLGYIRAVGLKTDLLNGRASASFSLGMPLLRDLTFKQLTLSGKARAEELRSDSLPGGFTMNGGALSFDVTERAVEASGDVKLNGVPVSVAWQRIFDAAPEHQPRLRIAAALDEKGRESLGLKVNHILKGELPIALAIGTRKDGPPQLSAEANLTNADLFLTAIGWRKPPGQRAVLTFEVEPEEGGAVRLENFRMTGDGLNIEGHVRLNEERRLAGFEFRDFSPNALTQLAIKGHLDDRNILKVRATGPSYDGRQFFRSLFSAGKLDANQPGPPPDEPGLDVQVEIDTVFGFFDTTVKSVTVEAKRRDGKLSFLDVSARLNGNAPVAVRVEQKPGEPRYLVAEAMDAGAAFRLVGFYPAVRGGQTSLRVNLDGSGPAEKTGTLYAQNFLIAGDQVLGQVVSRAEQRAARRGGRGGQAQTVQGDALQFDRMVVPFSVGHGQFVLHDSAINGPLLGATMRGRIDFARDFINLSGTYVPLYGLNAVLGEVPILGDLLVSRRGEGLLGMTFAVQGRMANPDVLVNPVSMVAPGFLRQIFEFDSSQPQVIPREGTPQNTRGTRPRAQAGTPGSQPRSQ